MLTGSIVGQVPNDKKRKQLRVQSCGCTVRKGMKWFWKKMQDIRRERERDSAEYEGRCWFLFYTLIYCRRYFLVGASWRLPHHQPRQWWSLDILFRIIARLAGPFYFGQPVRTTGLGFFYPSRQLALCWAADYERYAVSASNSAAVRLVADLQSRDRTEGFNSVRDMLDGVPFSFRIRCWNQRNAVILQSWRIKRFSNYP